MFNVKTTEFLKLLLHKSGKALLKELKERKGKVLIQVFTTRGEKMKTAALAAGQGRVHARRGSGSPYSHVHLIYSWQLFVSVWMAHIFYRIFWGQLILHPD